MSCKRSSRRSSGWDRHAFTLIELVVSLLILALISLVVLTRTTRQLHDARVSTFFERLTILDHTSRLAARRQQQALKITFSSRNRQVTRQNERGDEKQHSIRIPVVVRKLGVRTERGWRNSVETEIDVAPNGRSANYALKLELSGGNTKYFGVVGATGQTLVLSNEGVVDALFE